MLDLSIFADYDHEAFLGEEAKTFDDLTPEESKSRLAIIVDKIDKDKNGVVTGEELQEWIKFTQKRYIYEVRPIVCHRSVGRLIGSA